MVDSSLPSSILAAEISAEVLMSNAYHTDENQFLKKNVLTALQYCIEVILLLLLVGDFATINYSVAVAG